MGAGCAPLVAGLFLFCYERDFVLSLSANGQANVVEAFSSASGYLDGLLNVGDPCFAQMVGQVCPTELHLNRVNP